MAVAVGDVFLMTIRGTFLSQRIMLTHHWLVDTVGGTYTEQEVSEAFLDVVKSGGGYDLESPYCECLPLGYSVNEIWMQKIRVGRYRRRSVAGTEAGVLTTPEVSTLSAALTLTTDGSGRNQQSVKKIGPLPSTSDYINDGLLTNTLKIALLDFGALLATPIETAFPTVVFKPCIYHGEVPFPAPDVITGWNVEDTARVASRRIVGRGI